MQIYSFNNPRRPQIAPSSVSSSHTSPAGSMAPAKQISFGSQPTYALPYVNYAFPYYELDMIADGLRGWNLPEGIFGPEYFPNQSLEDQLFNIVNQKHPIDEKSVDSLTNTKIRVHNFYALTKDQPPIIVNSPAYRQMRAKAYEFLDEYQHYVRESNELFRQRFHFNDQEIELFDRFTAKTAPILFNMGFPDAVSHAAQVSRLAGYKAQQIGTDRATILQSTMVGWLHDPKYDAKISFENLVTHPAVASAIARHILIGQGQDRWKPSTDFQKQLQRYLDVEAKEGIRINYEEFAKGVMEALSINNDSGFVLEKALLPLLEKQFPRAQDIEQLKEIALQRFKAPSKNVRPLQFPAHIAALLRKSSLKTGLLGLEMNQWEKACREVSPGQKPDVLLNDILNGKPYTEAYIPKLRQALSQHANAFQECDVSGLTVFSHHDEVSKAGRAASLSLVLADSLLLSPYKVLYVHLFDNAHPETWMESLSSYMESFETNLANIPKSFQDSEKPWERAVYITILQAAEQLAQEDGRPNPMKAFQKAHEAFKKETGAKEKNWPLLLEDIAILKKIINNPDTWGSYANLDGRNQAANKGLNAIKACYENLIVGFRNASMRGDGSVLTYGNE